VTNRGRSLRTTLWGGLVALCTLGRAGTANAQAAGQLWGTGTVTWLATDRLQVRVQVEPEAQLIVPSGQPTFFSVDTTPRALFIVAPWIDVLGEIDFGTKNQSNEVNTTSVTPRIGVQLHILSRILAGGGGRGAEREPESRLRLDFRSLLRLEDEQQKSSTDSSFSSSWTFRDRFRVAYPLNRPKVTSSGAVYVTTDAEAFVPLDGGFINQLRVRSGIGYRRSFPWRFEALYIWTGERSYPSDPLAVKNHALDLRAFFEF
jgi:hypothetical protein